MVTSYLPGSYGQSVQTFMGQGPGVLAIRIAFVESVQSHKNNFVHGQTRLELPALGLLLNTPDIFRFSWLVVPLLLTS